MGHDTHSLVAIRILHIHGWATGIYEIYYPCNIWYIQGCEVRSEFRYTTVLQNAVHCILRVDIFEVQICRSIQAIYHAGVRRLWYRIMIKSDRLFDALVAPAYYSIQSFKFHFTWRIHHHQLVEFLTVQMYSSLVEIQTYRIVYIQICLTRFQVKAKSRCCRK